MKLTIDFESRSPLNLKKTSSWVYASHPHTQIMCLTLKVDDGLPYLYIPDSVRHLYPNEVTICPAFRLTDKAEVEHLLQVADTIEAHHLEFEISLWTCIMRQYGFPDLREEPYFSKLRCSASVCAHHALPRKLEKACEVLDLPEQKDIDGHKLMLKMCKPRTPRKAEKAANPLWEYTTYYHEPPEDILKQAEYCAQDVNAEHCLSDFLGELPPTELEVWRIDQRANWRGVTVDLDLCERMIALREAYLEGVVAEFRSITGFNPSQTTKMPEWLNVRGVVVEGVGKDILEELIETEEVTQEGLIVGEVRRVIDLRLSFAKTSLKKLDAAVNNTCVDGRMRSNLMYHGAATGRWSGKGMQLQNLPSRDLIDTIAECTAMIQGGIDAVTLSLYYPDMQKALVSCVRGAIIASPNMAIYSADFSSIEGRVLAWLAGDQHIIQGYIDGLCMYKIAAAIVFDIPYEEVTKKQRTVGKVPELGGGYQGWWRAYAQFANTYKIRPPKEIVDSLVEADFTDWDGTVLTKKEAAYCKWFVPIVRKWRKSRPGTVKLWKDAENAAKSAIKNPGQVFECADGRISYGVTKNFLQCRLPSGRKLYYYKPKVVTRGGKEQITFWGTDSSKGGTWRLKFTHGGKLVENFVQGSARDFMSEAMIRIDRKDIGLELMFTVHDEINNEGPEDVITLTEYEDLMSVVPDWAEGCPISAEGWIGDRYRK